MLPLGHDRHLLVGLTVFWSMTRTRTGDLGKLRCYLKSSPRRAERGAALNQLSYGWVFLDLKYVNSLAVKGGGGWVGMVWDGVGWCGVGLVCGVVGGDSCGGGWWVVVVVGGRG